MIKNYFFVSLLLGVSFQANAQLKVQGIDREDIKIEQLKSQKVDANFSFDDIKFWVGEGSKKAGIVIQWNNKDASQALVWGYRFDGEVSGKDMLLDIAKNDPRLYLLILESTRGTKLGGAGFDADNKGIVGMVKDNRVTSPYAPKDGIINTSEYDFDQWTNNDNADYWGAGWIEKGFWTYWTKEVETEFDYSGIDANGRALLDGSWDIWSFNNEMEDAELATIFTAVESYVAPTFDFEKGVFIVNEDWFGHSNGSVNFISNDGKINHNTFKSVNPTADLGVTTQYGTVYGDNFYFVSKQGNRLVVADAKTLKQKASFSTIGGDGRSFIGVDTKTGYLGTSNGLYQFDIENLALGSLIEGADKFGALANMIRTSQYVFAVTQRGGILVIDPKTHKIKQTIAGSFISVVQSKDGNVWGALANKLVKINPETLEKEEIAIPTRTVPNSWGAWNAGSFASSTQQNVLYFLSGINVVKFDATTKTFEETFFQLPSQDTTPRQTYYGAGLRIDPVTDDILLTTIGAGWGANSEKNFVHRYNNQGEWKNTVRLNDYYWFPALPVFPDANLPQINGLETTYNIGTETIINLKDKVSDQDNIAAAIIKDLEIIENDNVVEILINEKDELVVNPLKNGTAKVKVSFNSNGKIVDQTITFTTSVLGTSELNKSAINIYPNPVNNVLFVDVNESTRAEIFAITGNKIIEKTLQKGKNQIDVSSLQKGVYIIKVNNSTFKVIKK